MLKQVISSDFLKAFVISYHEFLFLKNRNDVNVPSNLSKHKTYTKKAGSRSVSPWYGSRIRTKMSRIPNYYAKMAESKKLFFAFVHVFLKLWTKLTIFKHCTCFVQNKLRIRLWIRIRILLLSSVTFKTDIKNDFGFLLFEATFTSFFKDKKS
jgi:hypothetical protein